MKILNGKGGYFKNNSTYMYNIIICTRKLNQRPRNVAVHVGDMPSKISQTLNKVIFRDLSPGNSLSSYTQSQVKLKKADDGDNKYIASFHDEC